MTRTTDRVQKGRNRSAAIAIVRGQILRIERNRPGIGRYYVFPGGGVEPDETPKQTVIRELREECGLRGKVIRRVFTSHTLSGGQQDYFLVKVPYLPVALPKSAEERSPERIKLLGRAEPKWISLSQFRRRRVFPSEIVGIFLQSLLDGFPKEAVDFGVIGFSEKRFFGKRTT